MGMVEGASGAACLAEFKRQARSLPVARPSAHLQMPDHTVPLHSQSAGCPASYSGSAAVHGVAAAPPALADMPLPLTHR